MGLIYAQYILSNFTTHEHVEHSHFLFDLYLLLNIHWYKLQKRSKTN